MECIWYFSKKSLCISLVFHKYSLIWQWNCLNTFLNVKRFKKRTHHGRGRFCRSIFGHDAINLLNGSILSLCKLKQISFFRFVWLVAGRWFLLTGYVSIRFVCYPFLTMFNIDLQIVFLVLKTGVSFTGESSIELKTHKRNETWKWWTGYRIGNKNRSNTKVCRERTER